LLDSNVDVIPAVTAHVASIFTGGGYGLQIYGPDRDDVPIRDRNLARAFEQAAVVESHPPIPGSRRGVNTNSGAITQTGFSRSLPGTYGRHYVYPDRADFAYLRGRGLNLARIPFRWERVQPQLNKPLKSAELDRLRSCFDDASAAGMRVIPNVHNYGKYAVSAFSYPTLGSTALPIGAYRDLWVRLAEAWKDHPAVAGYDIMGEPHSLPGGIPTWEKASQAAVEGIRSTDATTRIWVAGYNTRPGYKNGLFCFVANHPRAWITAPRVGYTCHAYYGPGAAYKLSYAEAVAFWQSEGY
jgi:aryl-phospho-beta-D-glucosidase BglC (GH1 family)